MEREEISKCNASLKIHGSHRSTFANINMAMLIAKLKLLLNIRWNIAFIALTLLFLSFFLGTIFQTKILNKNKAIFEKV